MKAVITEHGVQLVRVGDPNTDPTPIETLTATAALDLALELLGAAASADNAHAAEAYGAVVWLSVGEVAKLLNLHRNSASRIVARMRTCHRRGPGGDRFVARVEVDAWAARALGVTRKRRSAA